MDERCDHFVELTQAAGYPCDVFKATPLRRRGPGDIDRKGLAKWVKGLPKPVGIMVCNDDRGLELLDACRHARVPVPEQAAVISVDNDEYLCGFSIPPLSSVDVAPHGIGYEAASLLDRMMAGKAATQQARVIPPGGVVVRQSTDVLATDDATVARAIEFIQKHACDRIKIADVVEHVVISRAGLEPRLKAVVGRTIHQEIQHAADREGQRSAPKHGSVPQTDLASIRFQVHAAFGEGLSPNHRRDARSVS